MTLQLIAPVPKLAELREAVLARSEKRKPKWGFRLAADIVMELQAQPCTLLSDTAKAMGYPQAVLKFEGHAVKTPDGAGPMDLKRSPRGACSRKFSIIQFDSEPNWQLTLGRWSRPAGSGMDFLAPLDAAILESFEGGGMFTSLSPARMLRPSCMICGKALTDPASMARWIGPECAATTSIRIFRETQQVPEAAPCMSLLALTPEFTAAWRRSRSKTTQLPG